MMTGSGSGWFRVAGRRSPIETSLFRWRQELACAAGCAVEIAY
jgi:hypothetical protein